MFTLLFFHWIDVSYFASIQVVGDSVDKRSLVTECILNNIRLSVTGDNWSRKDQRKSLNDSYMVRQHLLLVLWHSRCTWRQLQNQIKRWRQLHENVSLAHWSNQIFHKSLSNEKRKSFVQIYITSIALENFRNHGNILRGTPGNMTEYRNDVT